MPRDPGQLSFQSTSTKRWILLSYWAVILAALPLWWHTTSITRLSLPTSKVRALSQQTLRLNVNIHLDPSLSHFQPVITQNSWGNLDVRIATENAYEIVPGTSFTLQGRTLTIPADCTPELLKKTLESLLIPSIDSSSIQYYPRYRLSFTLMNQDSADGHFVTDWDINGGFTRYILPLVKTLSILHNFTVESQIQYHGPLAFDLQKLDHGHGLTREDLTVFVNSAEWTLASSVTNDPVLHFLLFVPSSSVRPLYILRDDNTISSSDSFLLPQWGGIMVHNPSTESIPGPLSPEGVSRAFKTFATQLEILLGIPPIPHHIQVIPSSQNEVLNPWQFDTLLRQRTIENVQAATDTLSSTVKLVHEIDNMPVDKPVKKDVQDSLEALESMYSALKTLPTISLPELLSKSAIASTLSSKAFFNPGMLALLYFPSEHKFAVYTPLFASALIPPVVVAIKELSAWRRERRNHSA